MAAEECVGLLRSTNVFVVVMASNSSKRRGGGGGGGGEEGVLRLLSGISENGMGVNMGRPHGGDAQKFGREGMSVAKVKSLAPSSEDTDEATVEERVEEENVPLDAPSPPRPDVRC